MSLKQYQLHMRTLCTAAGTGAAWTLNIILSHIITYIASRPAAASACRNDYISIMLTTIRFIPKK